MEELQWHEPAAYRRAVARQRGREGLWEAIKVAVITFFALIAVQGFSVLTRPDANRIGWPAMLTLALVVALLLAFGLPRFLLLFPNSIVILSKTGINNNIIGTGARIRFWLWEEISSCRISPLMLDGRNFLTLRLYGLDGQIMETFGLGDESMVVEIERLLRRHGKQREVDSV